MIERDKITPPRLCSVYDGTRCIGFVLRRVDGFEGFDAGERSLGVFDTMKAAADAISAEVADE